MNGKNIFLNLSNALLGILTELGFVALILIAAFIISYFIIRIF